MPKEEAKNNWSKFRFYKIESNGMGWTDSIV